MKMLLLLPFLALLGCDDASIASRNLSVAADNFEILRRIVFYNGITGDYILSIEGRCSFKPNRGGENSSTSPRVSVVCKKGAGKYVKHTLGISDNVTYFSEQLKAEPVSAYHYRVIFKPQTIVPNIDFKANIGSEE